MHIKEAEFGGAVLEKHDGAPGGVGWGGGGGIYHTENEKTMLEYIKVWYINNGAFSLKNNINTQIYE